MIHDEIGSYPNSDIVFGNWHLIIVILSLKDSSSNVWLTSMTNCFLMHADRLLEGLFMPKQE